MKLSISVLLAGVIVLVPAHAGETSQKRDSNPDHYNMPPLLAFAEGAWISDDPQSKVVETWAYQPDNTLIGIRKIAKPEQYQVFAIGEVVKMLEMRGDLFSHPARFLGNVSSTASNHATVFAATPDRSCQITMEYSSPSPGKLDLDIKTVAAGLTTARSFHYKKAEPKLFK
ncbi:MAG TPA: hypothetical protein V6C72_00125 [Chroococcales cyanobacterium]